MKVKKKFKTKITGSIIGLAMAGPTGPFAMALCVMHCTFADLGSNKVLLLLHFIRYTFCMNTSPAEGATLINCTVQWRHPVQNKMTSLDDRD